jgi:hypothetical protein
MKRNPLYTFTDLNSKGIDKLPLNTIMQIIDIDGNSNNGVSIPKMIQLSNKNNVDELTTVGQFLLMTDNYLDLSQVSEVPSELEKITEGTVTGWRMLGRDQNGYGPIGRGAIDLSKSSNVVIPNPPYGAQGENSLASGYKTLAGGFASHAEGIETIAQNKAQTSIGKYNIGVDQNNIFEVGIGTALGNRRNALEITTSGVLLAPEMTTQDIDSAGITSLVTKEYNDANLASKLSKAGDSMQGLFTIDADIINPDAITLDNYGTSRFRKEILVDTWIKTGLDIGNPSKSRINFSDTIQTTTPSIYWNTSLKNFFVDTDLLQDQKLWHAGNDGIGSGLDADTIHGINGADIATNADLVNGLALKLNNTGGAITGHLIVTGTSDLQGTVTTTSVISDNLTSVNINSSGNTNLGSVNISSGLAVNAITSNTVFNSGVVFNDVIETQGLVTVTSGITINANGARDSVLNFQDTNAPTNHRSIYWSTDLNKFMVKPDGINPYELWHDGNLPLSSFVTKFDDLLDTPNIKEANKFLQVSTDGTSIIYSAINNSSATWGSINGDINIQPDLVAKLNEKFDKLGGIITGSVITQGTSDFVQDATFQGNVSISGTVQASVLSVPTITSAVSFGSTIQVAGNISTATDVLCKSVIIGVDTTGYSSILFEPSGGVNPSIYWDTTTSKFLINDSTGFAREIYHSGNYNSLLKYDVTGGDITGQINVIAHPTNPTTYGYGDILVERNVSVGGTLTTAGNYTATGSVNVNGVFTTTAATSLATTTIADLTVLNATTLNATTIQGPTTFQGIVGFSGIITSGSDITANASVTLDGSAPGVSVFSVVPLVTTAISSDSINLGTPASIGTTTTIDSESLVINAANVDFSNLPTVDPLIPGRLWNNLGTLQISL